VSAFEWIVAVCLVLWTLLGIATVVGVIALWLFVRGTFSRLSQRVEGILKETQRAAKVAGDAADYVAERARTVADAAQSIASHAEKTAKDVSNHVLSTTGVVRDAVAEPALRLASLIAGIKRGWETWAGLRREKQPRQGPPSGG
jgi:predicted PurR-regulated permease PerM